jgi:hypothetical protein
MTAQSDNSDRDANLQLLRELEADARKLNKSFPIMLAVGHGACLLFFYQSIVSGAVPSTSAIANLGWFFVAGAASAFYALTHEWNVVHGEASWVRASVEGRAFDPSEIREINASILLWKLCVGISGALLLWGVSAPLRNPEILSAIAAR